MRWPASWAGCNSTFPYLFHILVFSRIYFDWFACLGVGIQNGEGDQLASILPQGIQPDCLVSSPSVFPLGLHITHILAKNSHLLVGESAHRCHPVGGQGLNLCWRDIRCLMKLVNKFNSQKSTLRGVISLYPIYRYADIITVSLITYQ